MNLKDVEQRAKAKPISNPCIGCGWLRIVKDIDAFQMCAHCPAPKIYEESKKTRIHPEDVAALIKGVKDLREGIRFLLSFVPEWAKEAPPGLDPTMYGTLTQEGDQKVIDEVERIKLLLED